MPGGQTKVFKFRNLKTAYTHFAKHTKGHIFNWKKARWKIQLSKKSMPSMSFSQYLDEADKFFKNTKNVISYYSKSGHIYKYNLQNGYFGVINPTGEIATFYKPTGGIKYFIDTIK